MLERFLHAWRQIPCCSSWPYYKGTWILKGYGWKQEGSSTVYLFLLWVALQSTSFCKAVVQNACSCSWSQDFVGSEEIETDFCNTGVHFLMPYHKGSKVLFSLAWSTGHSLVLFPLLTVFLFICFLIIFLHPPFDNSNFFFLSLPFFISLRYLAQIMENMSLFWIQIYIKDSLTSSGKKINK